MILQFGSFEIQSTSMKVILEKLNENLNRKYFFIAGDHGTGRSTLAAYINKSAFEGSQKNIFEEIESVDRSISSGIFMVSREAIAKLGLLFEKSDTYVVILPTLSERKADILPFANFFIEVLGLMNSSRALKLTEKASEKLLQYNWPGNFHELETVLENAFLKASQDLSRFQIGPEHIDLNLNTNQFELSIGQKLDEVERKYILQTLYFVHQNRTRAAEILGISIRTLRNKINQYREEGFL